MQYIHKMSQVVFWSLVVLCTTVVMTALVVSAYWHLQGGSIMAVQTGSMVPTFAPGDALVVRKVAHSDILVGDIVSYQSQLQTGVVVSHRVVMVDAKAKTITTRGDHLKQPDTPIPMNAIRGRAVVLLPKFGYVLNALHRPLGLILLLYMPALSIVTYELIRLNKCSYTHYVLAGYTSRNL